MRETGSTEFNMLRVYPIVACGFFLTVVAIVAIVFLHPYVNYAVELPVPRKPDVFFGLDSFLKVTLKSDGTIFVATDWVPPGQLHRFLPPHSKSIILAADARAPYVAVKATLRDIAASRPGRIILLTESQTSPFQMMLY